MKKLVLIVAVFLIMMPVVHAQDDDLERIIAAYEGYENWTSYAAQSTIRVQLAYSLDTEEESLSRTDSILHNFDAQYDVSSSSVAGAYSETSTGRTVSGDAAPQPSELTATLDLVGIDGTVYAAGDVERTADNQDNISIDEPTEVGRNLNILKLDKFADYSEFRNIDDVITLLEETGSVVSVETRTTRQYNGELEQYVITADAEQAIEAFQIDLHAQFSDLLTQDAVDEEALLEALTENADLELTVFLDAETGALVAENAVLLINVEWADDQIANGSLFIEYSYDYSVLYDAVNQPVDIPEP